MSRPSWKEVWKPPFTTDGCYIYADDLVMVFNIGWDMDMDDPWVVKLLNDIIKALNGEEIQEKYPDFTIENGCDLYKGDIEIGSFRGWGHLTGTGGLNLLEEEAEKVQDEMITYVMERICKDYGKEV